MPRRTCDGAGFLAAFRSAVANLEAHVEEVNALNVFPVPDGDTGTNMLATVRAALDEADRVGPTGTAGEVAKAASYGALMGARGNSGVITSQILAGLAHGLEGKRHFNGLDLAHALAAGTKEAYRAVAKPVEGTILTVIREASVASVFTAERDNDTEAVLAATVEAAERSVARTPSLLPVLREAKVVDSGGQGLFRLFQGALEAARGRPLELGAIVATPKLEAARTDETAFGYETVYLVRARDGQPLDIAAMTSHLEAIGESVLVAGDAVLAKVHVHNERPDQVVAYGLTVGAMSRITIENLDGQAHEALEAKARSFLGGDLVARRVPDLEGPGWQAPGRAGDTESGAFAEAVAVSTAAQRADARVTRLPLGVVAVAPSDGLADLLSESAASLAEYVAFRVVRGGQSANPSTGELLDAVNATQADALLLLPNNPNVVLAARQVAAMTDRPVHVVPTRNCAEGLAAVLRLNPRIGAGENADAMTSAGRSLQTMQVTEAVRDATVSGHKVRKGQTMVLDPDDGLLAVDNDAEKAVLEAFSHLGPGLSIVTIYYGQDATLDEAERLSQRIKDAAPGLEDVDVSHGGQPHYRYLISAE
jgi:DAK2 domain fusion protein YloV